MTDTIEHTNSTVKDLGAGLILRRATPDDAEALVEINSRMHSDDGPDKPDERVGAWVRDLLTRPHPTFRPDDFTVVEDTTTGQIVSTLNLISQTWSYEGIPFGVGRPELVCTLPEYRNRGLIRAQFEVVHQWSAERGQLVQAITGIPFYYRQFGYEMAMDLGGRRLGYEAHVPELKDGEGEPYLIRPATEDDLLFLDRLYRQANQRYPLAVVRDPAIWKYELNGQSRENANHNELRVITQSDGEPVGYLIHPWYNWRSGLAATGYELKAGVSWLAVTPSVIRYLWGTGGEYAKSKDEERTAFCFGLGAEHPAYQACAGRLPDVRPPYAWYLRVLDLPGFLRHIAPVLEKRLAHSIAVGHTGKLRINRYSQMLVLNFESGELTGVDEEKRSATDYGDLALPELTILQMIFGRSSFAELHAAFPDAYFNSDEAVVLFDILFPKRHSDVLGVA